MSETLLACLEDYLVLEIQDQHEMMNISSIGDIFGAIITVRNSNLKAKLPTATFLLAFLFIS